MAYTGTIVTEAEIDLMAGENADVTGDTEANHNYLVAHCEAELCIMLKSDIVTNWNSINTIYKKIFSEYAARISAISLITYNMAGYTSRIEAEDMINVHIYRTNEIKELLKNASVQDFLGI